MRDRLQTYAVSHQRRPGRDQHGHRRGPGHHQPAPGAAAARRHLRRPRARRRCSRSSSCPCAGDVTVNDAFRPVSKYFDRVWRPEQLPAALLVGDAGAHRPGRDRCGHGLLPAGRAGRRRTTGRSSCSPSGSGGWPVRCPRPRCLERGRRADPFGAERPLIVAGGGVGYSGAERRRWPRSARPPAIPVGQTQAGKGALLFDHPQCLGAIGSTGTTAANAIAARGRRRDRHRHPLLRLHDGQPHRLRSTPTCGSSTSTSHRSTRSSTPALAVRRRRAGDARRR